MNVLHVLSLQKRQHQTNPLLVQEIEGLVQIQESRLEDNGTKQLDQSPLTIRHAASLLIDEPGNQFVHGMLFELLRLQARQYSDVLSSTKPRKETVFLQDEAGILGRRHVLRSVSDKVSRQQFQKSSFAATRWSAQHNCFRVCLKREIAENLETLIGVRELLDADIAGCL